ncbi:enoyl-CoA hydratase-related protein [Tenacibaculum maritimum]|uniref:enoyl-CoA hydratase-related protein n=1 Tax=Tenacibaculum maritimum TaxID=107401 RepID=UPI0012E66B04|nr:enoyl-CoA hydratase/isomerase family protein [Tenacibaculum maritimum]
MEWKVEEFLPMELFGILKSKHQHMNILFERQGRVLIAELNRPKVNALNTELMHELIEGLQKYDRDPTIGCFIIKGNTKFFSAGADILEMSTKTYEEMFNEDYFAYWELFSRIRTPKIAAVSGYAFGGGCELAMMCDFIYASDKAVFGQPEIKLGVIPGIGGSQRLTKLVGKSKAMEIILTGRSVGAIEAEKIGLVSKVFKQDTFWNQVLENANTIANYSKTASITAKDAVNQALESSLKDGIIYERKIFHALFNTKDQKEGMSAFLEKRNPNFNL